uniref:Uncharacterized protein n=1 Tax=Physcomitrium patens TaxID=3218 RepID=A0A2K1KW42_PHYPA|nr:hypothetical protein PHYPA_004983 [Physcomitrium patens]
MADTAHYFMSRTYASNCTIHNGSYPPVHHAWHTFSNARPMCISSTTGHHTIQLPPLHHIPASISKHPTTHAFTFKRIPNLRPLTQPNQHPLHPMCDAAFHRNQTTYVYCNSPRSEQRDFQTREEARAFSDPPSSASPTPSSTPTLRPPPLRPTLLKAMRRCLRPRLEPRSLLETARP